MTDTVNRLMSLADDYADWSMAKGKEHPTYVETRQALEAELRKLLTPLSDDEITKIAINQTRPAPYECLTVLLTGPGVDYKRFRSAGQSEWVTLEDLILYTRYIEKAHGITGGAE